MLRIQSYLSESLNVKNGLRYGDALGCLLFNIAIENVVRESNRQTGGTIFSTLFRYWPTQMILTSCLTL
jgi:hypothetical protein